VEDTVRKLEKILKGVDMAIRILSIGGGLATIGLFLFILTAIASRIFKFHFEGQVEFATLFLATIACCSLGYAMLTRTHVRVEAFFERLPPKLQKYLEGINHLLAIVFFGIITYSTAVSAHNYWVRMVYTEGTLSIPKWIASSIISLGCLFMVIALLILFLRLFISESGSTK
jgi:TRAP-type C4-dicarboxylate transport system permease small subunit